MSELDTNDPFTQALFEQSLRPVRVTQLEMIDGTDVSKVGSPGALTVFIAQKGADVLDEVRLAAGGDETSAQSLRQRFDAVLQDEAQPTFASDFAYAEMLVQAPVFADIRYGGQALSKGIFLPSGVDMVASAFPYNGGRLTAEGCSMAEYFQEGSDAELEGVVVHMAPPLTAAEKAALAKVPTDQFAQHISNPLDCTHTTYWIVGGAAFGLGVAVGSATAVAVMLAATAMPVSDNVPHLSDEELAQLDPSASARKLLAIRRQLLIDRFKGQRG